MSSTYTLALMILLGISQTVQSTSVICYHGTWSHYRSGKGKFSISDVPTRLCTHYIYAFVGLDSFTSQVTTLDKWLDFNLGSLASAVNLKNQNPDLKILVAVGGWNEGSAKYSSMAADAQKRATFVASALKFVQVNGFDGLDLDWEYPGRRDSRNAADKDNFAALVKELHQAFNPRGLLLTAAVSATPSSVDISYDVPAVSKYLDFINVMSYDFHGNWNSAAYHNAPLYSTIKLAGTIYADYSVNASIQGWLARGAPPSKLALGIPFYGRTMTLASSRATAPGSPLSAVAVAAGPYTGTPGIWGYNEIVEKFNEGSWTLQWDEEQQVPYAYSDSTWLSFENEQSIALKVEYAKNNGLGAVMLWSIETGDFRGLSGTQYPLLKTINDILGSTSIIEEIIPKSSSPTSTTTTSAVPVVKSPEASPAKEDDASISEISANPSRIPNANSCTGSGFYGSSIDCNVFYYCRRVNGAYEGSTFTCAKGLYYDTKLNICNYHTIITDSFLGAQAASVASNDKVIFCYFESWTVYRPGNGKFDVENIDPELCTHITFTFLGLKEDGTLNILDAWESNEDGLNGFNRFVGLKTQNPNLKTLISLGGWNEGSLKYSTVVADPVKRQTLVNSVVEFLDEHGFDGFDFDWEYPSRRDSTNPADKENFALMLEELHNALNPKGYLLSAAVNSAKVNIDVSYDVPALSKYLDHINVMAYDFHGNFETFVGHHTPLYSAEIDAQHNNSEWNIATGIEYWLSSGADPSKINLGLATYARTFTLADPSNTDLYAPINSGGTAGPYTRMDGILGYNEICELHPDAQDIWDDEQKVPHLVIDNQWIGYDNKKSLGIKIDYALEKQLGGFMVWSFDTDDFTGLCGDGTYPLTRTIHTKLAEHGYKLKTNH
ncbi:acidic mammalian chitinase-like [Euwallacea fornicatus]|uniref:acidic mammalian chitinase-like n=1 Tax=Euwallacea fornicatus TaxID=995702 RepID=UPI00338D7025